MPAGRRQCLFHCIGGKTVRSRKCSRLRSDRKHLYGARQRHPGDQDSAIRRVDIRTLLRFIDRPLLSISE